MKFNFSAVFPEVVVRRYSVKTYSGFSPATLLKKTLWHWCFSVNFTKFLRTPFFIEQLQWLLLYVFQKLDVNMCKSLDLTKMYFFVFFCIFLCNTLSYKIRSDLNMNSDAIECFMFRNLKQKIQKYSAEFELPAFE